MPEELIERIIDILKRAKHEGSENCSAEICEQITKVLRDINRYRGQDGKLSEEQA